MSNRFEEKRHVVHQDLKQFCKGQAIAALLRSELADPSLSYSSVPFLTIPPPSLPFLVPPFLSVNQCQAFSRDKISSLLLSPSSPLPLPDLVTVCPSIHPCTSLEAAAAAATRLSFELSGDFTPWAVLHQRFCIKPFPV